jgi:hypothetical protein
MNRPSNNQCLQGSTNAAEARNVDYVILVRIQNALDSEHVRRRGHKRLVTPVKQY